MRFVLFDSVVAKECRIWDGWIRRQGPVGACLSSDSASSLLDGRFGHSDWHTGRVSFLPVGSPSREHMIPLILGSMALFFVVIVFVVRNS
jgi:hypothetical protein